MLYGKQEAVMTRGLAILSMVCLHLFCKLGDDIVYTPLIWLNDEIPLIYTVGFFLLFVYRFIQFVPDMLNIYYLKIKSQLLKIIVVEF